MLGEHHHDLSKEFPEYEQKIHQMKMENAHFRRLLDEYVEADKEVYRIEEGIETPDDDYTEELKKKRLYLKDQLFEMLKAG